jgi:CheY-like chemotaxis protein
LSSDSVQLGEGFVVLVEDDQQAREALEAQLNAWGLEFSSAGSLDEILSCLKQNRRVDAIIADYRLPGKGDGIDVILALREELGYPADAILMTAEVDLTSLHAGLPHRTSLLSKPFEPEVLRSSLRNALDRFCLPK